MLMVLVVQCVQKLKVASYLWFKVLEVDINVGIANT